jgi:hypothetical protein
MSLTKKMSKNHGSANNWHLEAADATAADSAAVMDALEPADAAVEVAEAVEAVEVSEAVVLRS